MRRLVSSQTCLYLYSVVKLQARFGLQVHPAVARRREPFVTDWAVVGFDLKVYPEMALEVAELACCLRANFAYVYVGASASFHSWLVPEHGVVLVQDYVSLQATVFVNDGAFWPTVYLGGWHVREHSETRAGNWFILGNLIFTGTHFFRLLTLWYCDFHWLVLLLLILFDCYSLYWNLSRLDWPDGVATEVEQEVVT